MKTPGSVKRRRSPWAGLALALAALAGPGAGAELALRDDSGAVVRLAAPAQRIVSLAPNITENLFAVGAGGRVVGTVEFSDYPADARRIARIGGYGSVDIERIVALHPDLVIAWQSGNSPSDIEALRHQGIPIFLSEPVGIDAIAVSLEQLGTLAGTADAGARAAADFRARLAVLRRPTGTAPPVRTFYQIWADPPTTIGGRQMIDAAIRLCGGENIFGALHQLAPVVSIESIVAADPEAIVASGDEPTPPPWMDAWRRWPRLTAVARGNLFFIPPDLIQRHTPRILEGVAMLCEDLQVARTRRGQGR